MATLFAHKVVASLPGVLGANTIYAVRVGIGFDLFITDSTGATAHSLNTPVGLQAWEAITPSSKQDAITVSATAPASPTTGQLWLDIS